MCAVYTNTHLCGDCGSSSNNVTMKRLHLHVHRFDVWKIRSITVDCVWAPNMKDANQICFLFLPLRRSGCSEWSKTALGSEKSAAVSLNLAPPLGMVTWAYFSHQKDMFYQGNKATVALKEKCGTFGGNTVASICMFYRCHGKKKSR